VEEREVGVIEGHRTISLVGRKNNEELGHRWPTSGMAVLNPSNNTSRGPGGRARQGISRVSGGRF
jgi:hypothetical protein